MLQLQALEIRVVYTLFCKTSGQRLHLALAKS